MADYKKLYFELFNKITDIIEVLENEKQGLLEIQRKAERLFIADESNEGEE